VPSGAGNFFRKKVLTNLFFGDIITDGKAMTKKAELQSFQRGGVWCEPSAEHFNAIPSEPKLRKSVKDE
jgi:hypothetical protein